MKNIILGGWFGLNGVLVTNNIKTTCADGVVVNGKKYTSLIELATDLDVPESIIIRRLLGGCSFLESIRPYTRHNGRSLEVVYEGVPYPSKMALCTVLGVRAHSLDTLINSGHPLDSAIKYLLNIRATRKDREEKGLVVHRNKVYNLKPITLVFPLDFEGKPYENLMDIAKAHKLNYNTFRSRLKWDWSLEEAVYGRKK